MAGWQASGGLGAAAAGVGLAAVAVVVWLLQQPQDRAPDAARPPAPDPAAQTAAPTGVATGTEAAPVALLAPSAPAEAPAPADPLPLPSFDTVRVTPEGEALVAGQAEAGAEVSLQVDGVEVAQAQANAQGSFVSQFTLPPADQPRLLSLVQRGTPERRGAATVALAPLPGPAPSPETPADMSPPAPPELTAEAAPPAEAPQGDAPLALLVTDQGASVLQGTASETADLTIDTLSYTPDGAVQIAGRGQGGDTVRLYLDNTAQAEALVAASGQWFATLRDITPGLYTLRADQIAQDGRVAARFETPFLRETPAALAAALKPQATPGTPVPAKAPAAPEQAPATAPAAATLAEAPPAAPTAQAPLSVTVQPGFTLWRIARENFGDGVMYVKVFEANKDQIRNPDLIYPGQVFTIPGQ